MFRTIIVIHVDVEEPLDHDELEELKEAAELLAYDLHEEAYVDSIDNREVL